MVRDGVGPPEPRGAGRPRILVAGVGNVLTGDDGFGVRVADALAARTDLPENVTVVEVGIGGIHLVQELMEGYDALVIVDAVDRDDPPGRVVVLEPSVPEIADLAEGARTELLAETHYAVPAKAMTLAKALGALPDRVRIVGCQPETIDLGEGLSDVVAGSVGEAIVRVLEVVDAWTRPVEEVVDE